MTPNRPRRPNTTPITQTPSNRVIEIRPKAAPPDARAQQHYRLRYDRLDTKDRMSLRRAGRMHHLGIGAAHARQRVLALADDHQITVTDLATGEVISTHRIEPHKTYWRNQQRTPGRWPKPPHLRPITRLM
jgi:hypothetical protein